MPALPTVLTAALLVAAGGCVVLRAQAQNACADCHVANPGSVSMAHLSEWDASPHGRNRVGCDGCHGGNPRTFEPFVAHRDILARANPASPVHRTNEPATCGSCHAGPFEAFRKSRHYQLLRSGDTNVPTCATCHGEVAGLSPSPRALEAQCARCHGNGKVAPRPEYPVRGRLAFEGLHDLRLLLTEIRHAIARVNDPVRRASLEGDARLADQPIQEATQAAHAYVYDQLDERLATARARVSALFDRVANPGSR